MHSVVALHECGLLVIMRLSQLLSLVPGHSTVPFCSGQECRAASCSLLTSRSLQAGKENFLEKHVPKG